MGDGGDRQCGASHTESQVSLCSNFCTKINEIGSLSEPNKICFVIDVCFDFVIKF